MTGQPRTADEQGAQREVGLGLVGTGNWAGRLARCVEAVGGARLLRCFSRDPARRRSFASDHDVDAAPSLDALLADPRVEGVLVATPHSAHADVVCEVASAGKHVFVEKPLALSVADAQRCIAAANAAGVILQVDHFRRRMPATRATRRLLDSGALGEVHHLGAFFSRPVGQQRMRDWKDDVREAPAGGMTTLGVHMVDNLHYLGGPIAAVNARSKRLLGRGSIDDVTGILIEFEAGPLGFLGTSLVLPTIITTEVLGTRAAAWSEADASRLFLQRTGEDITREEIPLEPVDAVADSVADFVRCIRTGGEPETGGREGLAVVAVLEAVTLSAARGGQPVDLADVAGRA